MKTNVRFTVSCAVVILSLMGLILWGALYETVNFYMICAAMLILSMLPFLIGFERRERSAREVTVIATFIALAVISRAAFYLIPQVKPIGAVVVIAGVCLGAQRGYLVGAFSAFISNFIFGQGYWTPFQMAALGLVGFFSGAIFHRLFLQNDRSDGRKNMAFRLALSLVGFLLTFAVYGLIVDISTILMVYGNHPTVSGILSVYGAGVPFSLVFGISTAVFLFLFGEAFLRKAERLNTKYGRIISE